MQSIKFCICEFLLIISLFEVNCYSNSEFRLDNWTPIEQIKFHPRKSSNEKLMFRNNDDDRTQSRKAKYLFNSPEFDKETSKDNQNEVQNSEFGTINDKISELENSDSNRKYFKLNKKEEDVLDILSNNPLDKLPNRTSSNIDDENNQHLIWFLMTKIIPTTTKLNQLLCNSDRNSTEQLCTSFNHLHLLVGKSKRSSNDETFRRARLIEDLSNEVDDRSKSIDKKLYDYNHKFSNKLNKEFDHSISKHNLHPNSQHLNFDHFLKLKKSHLKSNKFNYPYYLDGLINSKSIYKHHQRLKRTIIELVDQLKSGSTINQHKLAKRSLDNEIKYPDIQQFGKFYLSPD